MFPTLPKLEVLIPRLNGYELGEVSGDFAEFAIDPDGNFVHARDASNSDQGAKERVLDQILTLFVVPETLQHVLGFYV